MEDNIRTVYRKLSSNSRVEFIYAIEDMANFKVLLTHTTDPIHANKIYSLLKAARDSINNIKNNNSKLSKIIDELIIQLNMNNGGEINNILSNIEMRSNF